MRELQLRRDIKKKKPKFIRQDAHKKKRLGKKWRRPKGLQSKIRLGIKGYRRGVSAGYGSPTKVKGLDRSGLIIRHVSALKDIEQIDEKQEGVIIAKSVGIKKRLDLLKMALEKGINVLNIKDSAALIKKLEGDFKKRLEKKKGLKEKKKEKEKELKKKAKEKDDTKEGLAEKVEGEEEKQTREKKEKDKLLTKKDSV